MQKNKCLSISRGRNNNKTKTPLQNNYYIGFWGFFISMHEKIKEIQTQLIVIDISLSEVSTRIDFTSSWIWKNPNKMLKNTSNFTVKSFVRGGVWYVIWYFKSMQCNWLYSDVHLKILAHLQRKKMQFNRLRFYRSLQWITRLYW